MKYIKFYLPPKELNTLPTVSGVDNNYELYPNWKVWCGEDGDVFPNIEISSTYCLTSLLNFNHMDQTEIENYLNYKKKN